MKISVEKQTPVAALMTLVIIVAAALVRFGMSPYDNEMPTERIVPPLAEYLAAFSSSHKVLSLVISAFMMIVAGMIIGQTGSRFRLYPSQTFLSMPIYGIAACGIFVSADVLSSSLASLLTAIMLRYLCRGYLRERDLSAMLYAGLSIGLMMLVSTSGVVCVAAALSAIFILSFSARELFVLLIAMLLPVAGFCFTVWALGGEFMSPVMRIWSALFAESGVDAFGNDAVVALTLCGIVGFTFFCSTILFLADRFMVSLKSRGIFIFDLVLALLSLTMFALPSSSPANFAVSAVPMSMIMPVLFIREGGRLSAILYMSLWVVFVLHLLYY